MVEAVITNLEIKDHDGNSKHQSHVTRDHDMLQRRSWSLWTVLRPRL